MRAPPRKETFFAKKKMEPETRWQTHCCNYKPFARIYVDLESAVAYSQHTPKFMGYWSLNRTPSRQAPQRSFEPQEDAPRVEPDAGLCLLEPKRHSKLANALVSETSIGSPCLHRIVPQDAGSSFGQSPRLKITSLLTNHAPSRCGEAYPSTFT